jgi:hypothetical protein
MVTFAAFVMGSSAVYEQSIGMHIVFIVLCVILGLLIVIGHAMCDYTVSGGKI